ncbi:FAD-binding oxidoreductase [Pseudomonas savastanoi]|uniref:FAD-binding oxidoreductase n=1 Tax=Pseudomonas savastanoi TaxID=29438 RepID=A0A3M6ADA7_PSESS|nr:FAD-binding oxidoreductase [Pseudomonas syringae pv. cunninghamiae]RMV12149.1 FAD-binding oxidoreductase [Pseudomonas savastanoi]RMV16734.1 FAD-binding oxidoreductase [Pseudomonas savastanoi]RMV17323.1 FAD-binding oxidoreductase [Pseudomonas savastanoi]
MTPQKSDVLIIGGGFMGSSSAFFLRQHGRSVTLLERDQIGQYASGVNFGNVRRQGRFLGQLELSNRSWALWKTPARTDRRRPGVHSKRPYARVLSRRRNR